MGAVTHRLAAQQDWLCFYCEGPMTRATATRDHIVPKCRGGSNDTSNLVASCLYCNGAKADLDADLFIELRLDGLARGWWPAGEPIPQKQWRRLVREHFHPTPPEYLNLSLPGDECAA